MDGTPFNVNGKVDWEAVSQYLAIKRALNAEETETVAEALGTDQKNLEAFIEMMERELP